MYVPRMVVAELPKRKSRKKPEAVVSRPPLSPEDMQSLRAFVRFAVGDGHLSAWEENFLNTIKNLLYQPAVWLSDKQQAVIQQLKDKLHYDRPHVPLPAIDPDGIEDNDDPDGWPVRRHVVDEFEDDELADCLTAG